jgi:hypothetical protein
MDRRRIVSQIKAKGIAGKFGSLTIERELGSGGNGVAFLCRTPERRELVAKVYIPPDSRDLDERAYKRFKNEISLISQIRHPNVIQALDSGTISIGAYALPFYVMPLAAGTLRKLIGPASDADGLGMIFRTFLRAVLGTLCLHSNRIIHRDLKPENILIGHDGTPWIADLGIAHVSSELAATGLKTIASEKLRNQDYYAPEQRFGSPTEVDHRVDIYALGLILYELISGTPPIRVNAPKLGSIAAAFAPLDPIVDRMTAYDRERRYSSLEDVLEDLALNFGWVLANFRSGGAPARPDLTTMARLIKSQNDANRQRGVEMARRLGAEAVDALCELLGHGRREVRNSAALALGAIGERSSLPYLVGALYGTSDNATRFRPSADTAARALAQFPPAQRLEALSLVSQSIRPGQAWEILQEVPSREAYDTVLSLADRKLILLDWGETVDELLVLIDEERAWPSIKKRVADNDIKSSFRMRRFIGRLSTNHQVELMVTWLNHDIDDQYSFDNIMEIIRGLKTDSSVRRELLFKLRIQIESYRGTIRERPRLIQKLEAAEKLLGPGEDETSLVDKLRNLADAEPLR